jgi:hypothetical protein
MIDQDTIKEVFAIAEQRRAERRRFIKMTAAGIAATGALSALAACDNDDDHSVPVTPTPTPTPTAPATSVDVDVLNFALNLEYLEANYYTYSAFGSGLNAAMMTGTGQQGAVVGGKKVNFADASVASYAREIAADENAHVQFLRSQLGASAVAMPAINIDGTAASGAFAVAARNAGVANPDGTFDPYLNDDTWLLGGMLLSDVGVTAYKGSATLIANKVFLEAAAGILAVEAYHSGLIRTLLYSRGINPAIATTAANDRRYSDLISNNRDTIDGATTQAGPPQLYADDDQGVSPLSTDPDASNIVPSDSNGIVFGRTAANVLNVVYLNRAAVSSGGFFPAGVNGNIKTSNNNA